MRRAILVRSSWLLATVTTGLLLSQSAPVLADEGQWSPDQLRLLEPKLRERGLTLAANQLWNEAGDERDGGLMRAVVNLSGCTASFISPEGLIATNHHCAYAAIQANSSVEHDYLEHGFLARTRDEELEAKGSTVRVIRRIVDVTAEIDKAAALATDDLSRWRAISATRRALVDDCEKARPDARCDVASFFNGRVYRLFEYLELIDVRLVYAPPSSIGEYGGEIDNWMWPRHTGDFSLLRAYASPEGGRAPYSKANQPYRPAVWLPVSTDGVDEGDFVAIMGYPGATRRYMNIADVERWIEQVLPTTVSLFGRWIAILEARGAEDPAAAIRVAALKKSLANRFKNAQGMLDGLAQMQTLKERHREDKRLRKRARDHDDPAVEAALGTLAQASAQARSIHVNTEIVAMLGRGVTSLGMAIDLIRRPREMARPDAERAEAFTMRNLERTRLRREGGARDFDATVDAAVLALAIEVNAAQHLAQRLRALDGVDAKAAVAKTRLRTPEEFSRLWEAHAQELEDSEDPMIVLARALVPEIEALEREQERLEGARAQAYPRFFDLVEAERGGPLYPDANSTLRFSFAKIRGYTKWDGAVQASQTTLAQAIEKHTGEKPFNLPQAVRDGAAQAKTSRWADAQLGDLPLCFLADGDTTGGNSGSPVIDAQGRLVGLNFDRVWENIAGDFNWFDAHSRNVVVDARFLLWLLEDVEHAEALVQEIVHAGRPTLPEARWTTAHADAAGAGAAASASDAGAGSGATPVGVRVRPEHPDAHAPAGCACATVPSREGLGAAGLLGLVVGANAAARRRRRPRP